MAAGIRAPLRGGWQVMGKLPPVPPIDESSDEDMPREWYGIPSAWFGVLIILAGIAIGFAVLLVFVR